MIKGMDSKYHMERMHIVNHKLKKADELLQEVQYAWNPLVLRGVLLQLERTIELAKNEESKLLRIRHLEDRHKETEVDDE